jgi:hypothetical protein
VTAVCRNIVVGCTSGGTWGEENFDVPILTVTVQWGSFIFSADSGKLLNISQA